MRLQLTHSLSLSKRVEDALPVTEAVYNGLKLAKFVYTTIDWWCILYVTLPVHWPKMGLGVVLCLNMTPKYKEAKLFWPAFL